jgi:NitT/TauT family transport system substrate-binding protein
MGYVFNDHQRQTGLGRQASDRMDFTWQQVANSLELSPSWDYRQAIDLSFVP